MNQLMFAHKTYINHIKGLAYTDIHKHPFPTSLYPNDTKEIYVVNVRKARDEEESPYYGTLEEDGNFDFIFPSIHQTRICFPYDVSEKLYNLVLIEVGVIEPDVNLREDVTEILRDMKKV